MKSRFNDFWKDISTGILATIFAVWLLIGCSTMRNYANSTLAPSQVPSILAYALLVLAAIIVARAFVRRAKEKKGAPAAAETVEKTPLTKGEIFNEFIPYLTFLLIGLYLYGIKAIGFSVSTFLYLSVQISLLEKQTNIKRILRNVALAAIITAVVYVFFNVVLSMHLPVRAWFGKIRI